MKRSKRQGKKGKIYPTECWVPENVKASLKNALGDDAEVIQEKAAGDYSLHKKYTVFTNEADLTVKNSSSAIKANLAQHTLVLDNNITVDLKDFSTYAYGVSSSAEKFTLVSNNAAKMLKVSGKGSTLGTVAGYDMKNTALKIPPWDALEYQAFPLHQAA